MSLITRCPACGTMFKVVPDQLRISEGWVRCGHCAEVFDASAHMQDESPPQPLGAGAASTPLPVAADLQQATAPMPPEALAEIVPTWEAVQTAMAPEPAFAAEPEFVVEPLIPVDEPPVAALHREDDVAEGVDEEPQEAPPQALEDVSFLRLARRKAFWRRPLVRALLGIAAVALLAALALQVAVQERDRLAAAQPQLRPLLQALCEPLQCRVGPPRQIEAIVIDSSSFSKLRGDAYRLAFTLKNQAGMAIAMPAIELTLTDGQDQPLVRRVLTPVELGVASGLLDTEWSGSLAMSVAAAAGGGRVAGYRVLAFYP